MKPRGMFQLSVIILCERCQHRRAYYCADCCSSSTTFPRLGMLNDKNVWSNCCTNHEIQDWDYCDKMHVVRVMRKQLKWDTVLETHVWNCKVWKSKEWEYCRVNMVFDELEGSWTGSHEVELSCLEKASRMEYRKGVDTTDEAMSLQLTGSKRSSGRAFRCTVLYSIMMWCWFHSYLGQVRQRFNSPSAESCAKGISLSELYLFHISF